MHPVKSRRKKSKPVQKLAVQGESSAVFAGTHMPARVRWGSVLALWVLTAVVFGQVTRFDFVNYDDDAIVYENPYLREPSISNTLHFWTASHYRAYVPVTMTWLAAEAALAKSARVFFAGTHLNPAVFHAGNLLVHMASVLCVFLLLCRLLKTRPAALAGALLFALHPLQVDAVAWISNTKSLVSGLFCLCALLEYIALRQDPHRGSRHYAIALGCFALALLAKPTMAAVPLAMFALDTLTQRTPWRKALRSVLPFLLLSVIVGIVAAAVDQNTTRVPLQQRPFIAGAALSFYMWKLVWPLSLAPDYGLSVKHVPKAVWFWGVAVLPYMAAVVLVWRRNRSVMVAVAMFLAGVATVLGFTPFTYQFTSIVADRYLYLSMLGPAFLLGALLDRFPSRALKLSVGFALAIGGILSIRQTAFWRDSFALYEHVLAVNPNSWVAHNNLGLLYQRNDDIPNAIAHFERALAIRPHCRECHNNLGNSLIRAGRSQEAMAHFQAAIKMQPNDVMAYSNLAGLLANSGRRDEAITQLRRALALDGSLADLHYNLGLLLMGKPDVKEALAHLETAVRLRPDIPSWHQVLGEAWEASGDSRKAATSYEIALREDPGYAPSRAALQRLGVVR